MNTASTLPAPPTARDIASVFANAIHGWTLDAIETSNDECHAKLTGPNGAELVFRTGSYDPGPGRIEIHGALPRDVDGRTWTWKKHAGKRAHSITCSLTKSPEAIKADVYRRLLPAFLAEHAEAMKYFAERDAEECVILGVTAQLASIVGEELQDSRIVEEVRRHGCASFRKYETDGPSISVSVGSRVELKLRDLTTEQATAVLRLLKDSD